MAQSRTGWSLSRWAEPTPLTRNAVKLLCVASYAELIVPAGCFWAVLQTQDALMFGSVMYFSGLCPSIEARVFVYRTDSAVFWRICRSDVAFFPSFRQAFILTFTSRPTLKNANSENSEYCTSAAWTSDYGMFQTLASFHLQLSNYVISSQLCKHCWDAVMPNILLSHTSIWVCYFIPQ